MAYLELSSGPAVTAVSTDDVLDYLRLSAGDDDTNVADAIAAAVSHLDGRDGILNRALITQTWALHLDSFPSNDDPIEIPLPPLQSIVSVTYVDTAGTTQTWDAANYRTTSGYSQPAKLRPAYGKVWPSTRDQHEAVTVTFTAGYGDAATDVPGALSVALKMATRDAYDIRCGVVIGQTVNETPQFHRLIAPYIVRSFY